ncbi:MAG: hypothetical protein E7616_04160 [Ruminococcaceae bacterium]|nr:hypothetical protein [Oscillospiraceae bacterium]
MTKKSALIRFVLALAVTVFCAVAGTICGEQISEETRNLFGFLALGVTLFWLILIPVNLIAKHFYNKSKSFSARQAQEYYLSRRDKAMQDLPRVVKKMIRMRHITEGYSLFLLLSGLFVAFSMGIGRTSASFTLAPFYLIYGFLCRIAPRTKKFSFEGYSNPETYPAIHGMAKRAADSVGIEGNIRILFCPDSSASIAKVGRKTYSLHLGVELLDILSEEELYQILIHEFAHLTKDGNPSDKEYRLFAFITEREDNSLTALLNLLFAFTDSMYVFEYFIYRITSSVAIEQLADSAILKNGDPQHAANALAKTMYFTLFDRESSMHMEEGFYEPEQLRSNAVQTVCETFRKVLPKRTDFWRTLLANEIQPRSASHPIFRNRIGALGISDYSVTLPEETGDFRAECRLALTEVDKELYEMRKEDYPKYREENYLKPLAIVEEWRSAGSMPKAEEARPIMDALLTLGYTKELEALCDHIIEHSENVWATPHAHMLKGSLMLDRYDKSGIDHIYRAIELNKNYLEEGMNLVGQFCCLAGLQEELDAYREKALELRQNYEDEYSKTGELMPSDRLSREDKMPKAMLDGILSYIRSIDEDAVEQLYLVRKTISDTFFSSVFIVKFRENTDDETADRVLDKIFNHLDTHPADWQFSLFSYDERIAGILKKVDGCLVFDKNTNA